MLVFNFRYYLNSLQSLIDGFYKWMNVYKKSVFGILNIVKKYLQIKLIFCLLMY
jgi:hypothetical protein